MTDPKQKPVLDEQNFEKLLQAAHVLQEHNRKKQELDARMELHNERLREQEAASESPRQEPAGEPARPSDYTLTLAQIVEAQRQIQVRGLTLESAMGVVAERVAHITAASGAGIGIMEGKMVSYRAGSGAPALPRGSEVSLSTAICAASVRTGQVIRSEDINIEVLFDPEPCRQRGILSLLAVPIYHDGDIVGALELYFDRIHGFAEQDIHTCQLLAGLVTEAIGRDAETALKKSMAAERSTMLATIEKLQPKLEALAADQSAAEQSAAISPAPHSLAPHPSAVSPETALSGPGSVSGANGSGGGGASVAAEYSCWRCGGKLLAEEQFCGKCGSPRASHDESNSMQSKLASAWQRQQGKHESRIAPSNGASRQHDSVSKDLMFKDSAVRGEGEKENGADFVESSLLDAFTRLESRESEANKLRAHLDSASLHSSEKEREKDDSSERDTDEEGHIVPAVAGSRGPDSKIQALSLMQAEANSGNAADDGAIPTALAPKPVDGLAWTSAAKTREYLESLAGATNPLVLFWRSRRGDFYLAIAFVLLVAVIRWGIISNHAVSATEHKAATSSNANPSNSQAASDLSAFDKFLIAVGLAEAPQPPEYKGNPDIQVWVDLHTALYYCPGSDLYNKTAKGKMTSQRDAQLDQFEPANRKPCE